MSTKPIHPLPMAAWKHRGACYIAFGLWAKLQEGHPPGGTGQGARGLRTHWGDGGFLERRRAPQSSLQLLPTMFCSLGPAGARLPKL